MTGELNIRLFQWIYAGAGRRPIVDSIAIFFGRVGPYLVGLLFIFYSGIPFPLDLAGSLAVGFACAWMINSLAIRLRPLNDRFISFYMVMAARLASLKHLSARNC
jgi:hypothetical protein